VKVKLVVSMGSDLSVELPFTLTHPKPEPIFESSKDDLSNGDLLNHKDSIKPFVQSPQKTSEDQAVPVDHNLIEFDTRYVL
jgi:hypothetical protein